MIEAVWFHRKGTPVKKYVWDTSALISMFRSFDPHHFACYSFMRDREDDVHVFPAISWFEWQATLSRMKREGEQVMRDIYLLDDKNYMLPIDQAFISKADELGLHFRFSALKGADLVYACAAVIEGATLVTRDGHFRNLDGLDVIFPTDLYKGSFW